MSPNPRGYIGHCSLCGKRCFSTKRWAKNAAKTAHPGDHFNAYKCGTYWHYGHLPQRVKLGDLPRNAITRKANR